MPRSVRDAAAGSYYGARCCATRSHLPFFAFFAFMTADVLIEARQLARRDAASGKTLLAPSDFALAAGERIALTGPSGSGKSVFLRALALLDPIDGGELLWRGTRVPRPAIPRYRRSVAYVRQRPATAEGTVEDLLRYPYSLAAYRDAR
ncbi:ATP-binding cassette domain-containing protein, partial [Burkholderia pseudomallei]|uniref:ATP-binding cassette domain-containing protein n=1 Tax=Burkholderia pseudomallei TaxID=28450 RepID=UPI001EFB7154